MLDYLDVGTVRLGSTSTNDVTEVLGLTGLPPLRGSTYDRPEADGEVEPTYQYFSARTITVEGEVWGSSIDAAWTSWNALHAGVLPLVQTPGLMKWRRAGGTLDMQATVRLVGTAQPVRLAGDSIGPFLHYQMMFRAADPYLYSQLTSTISAGPYQAGAGMPFPIVFPIPFGLPTGGTFLVTNNGNAATWPLLTINGPINGPVIGNLTTGKFLYLDTLNLVTGDQLLIDTNPATRSILLAGASQYSTLRFSSSVWPSASAGVTETWQFYSQSGGTSGATTAGASWRDAYIS